MGTAVITGAFAIAGVLVGTLLEPVKLLIASRARTRNKRAEWCASFIQAAATVRHGLVQLNSVDRAKRAGEFAPAAEQVHAWIAEINKAKDDLRSTAALLRLCGPDELADRAGQVVEADERLFRHGKDGDDGEHDLHVVPPMLLAAARALDVEVEGFAVVARRHTR